MSIELQPVIMAGGSGTRLWPLSRAGYPKQFLVLSGNTSLFQQAVARLQGLASDAIDVAPPVIVGNEEHRFLVLDQLRESKTEPAAVLLEPMGRNTAPALTLAALQALQDGADPVLVVTPADQTVTDAAGFTARAARGRRVRRGRRHRDPRHPADPARNRLRLHPRWQRPAARPRSSASSKSPTRPPPSATWPKAATTGTAACSCCARRRGWPRSNASAPTSQAPRRGAWEGRSIDAKFVRPGAAEFAAVPAESIDYAVMERCPGSGLDNPDGAARRRLERPRRLGRGVAGGREGRRGQRGGRRRAVQRQPQLAGARDQPAGRRGRARRRGRGRDPRRGAGGRPSAQPGGQADRQRGSTPTRAASARCTARCTGRGAGTTASTTGRASRSSASWSSPARQLEPADAPPPRRALDRRQRHRRGDQRRQA